MIRLILHMTNPYTKFEVSLSIYIYIALAVPEIFMGCKILNPDHAPFIEDFSSAGWDWL